MKTILHLTLLLLFLPSTLALALPYPQSDLIKGIELDWTTHQRGALGSDNFQLTWANDDHLYGAWGDGSGFNSSDISLGVSRISGDGDNWTGEDIWLGGPRNARDKQFSGKSWGMISVNGILYMWFVPDVPEGGIDRDHYAYIDLAKSEDMGKSWAKTGVRFYSTENITIPTFINFGKDNAGAPDGYVYSYFLKPGKPGLTQKESNLFPHAPGAVYLSRCLPKTMENGRVFHEWFAGLNSQGTPQWGSLQEKVPVFEDPEGAGWCISAHFNPGLKRYILATQHGDNYAGMLGTFEARQPWGPWKTIRYYSKNDYFGKDRGASTMAFENNVFFISWPTKWLSENGENFTLTFTGAGRGKNNDSFNTVKGRFILPQNQ